MTVTTPDPLLDLHHGDMTSAEVERARSYVGQVAVIRDCFDAVDNYGDPTYGDPADLKHLVALSPLLQQAWDAIDSLYGHEGFTEGFRAYFESQVQQWFDLRRDYLLAIGRCVGAAVPFPEHDANVVTFGGVAPVGAYDFRLLTDQSVKQ